MNSSYTVIRVSWDRTISPEMCSYKRRVTCLQVAVISKKIGCPSEIEAQ